MTASSGHEPAWQQQRGWNGQTAGLRRAAQWRVTVARRNPTIQRFLPRIWPRGACLFTFLAVLHTDE